MIDIQNLCKNYGKKKVLNNLSLHVNKGDVLGFIGPNGAGKTTTMKMLCGVMPVYQGCIRLKSLDITQNPIQAKMITGYLPENAPLYSNMSVEDFLIYAARMHGIPSASLQQKMDLATQRCSLKHVLHEEIDALSKGYKRRVCLAQAIIHEPEILVMDEPTDGLDPNQKREIRNLINVLRQDTAIIISTHILEEVEAVCNRVALLCAGEKVFDDTTQNFQKMAEAVGTVAIEVAPEDLGKASDLLLTHFGPALKIIGSEFRFCCSRQQDEQERLQQQIMFLVKQHQIRLSKELFPIPAKLDDIFAELTKKNEGESKK